MLKKLIANSDTYEKILITLIAQRDRCTTVEEMEFHEEIIDDYIECDKYYGDNYYNVDDL